MAKRNITNAAARPLLAESRGGVDPRQLAPWQIEDAKRLRQIWDAHPKPKLSQAEFGARFDLGSQGMVWQLLSGKRALNTQQAAAFAEGLGCKVEDFSPRLAKEIGRIARHEPTNFASRFTLIDHYRDARHAAGPGDEIGEDGEIDKLAFRNDWLRENGWYASQIRAAPVTGRSMEPTINSGDLILIDTSNKTIKNGAIYAIRDHTGRRVKRLFETASGSLKIVSDNRSSEFEPETVEANKRDQVEIIGRVVWVAGRV